MSTSRCPAPSADRAARRTLAVVVVCVVGMVAGCASDGDVVAEETTTGAPETSATAVGDGAAAEPVPSAGCGNQELPLETTSIGTFESEGVERSYLLGVPSSDDGETPMPLVLDMHGATQTATMHDNQTRMTQKGQDEGFVTVSPQGIGALNGLWVERDGIDTAFIGELLDSLEARLCLDTSRFYLTGFSCGAMMTALLSCIDADRFAAAAPVAAQLLMADCRPSRPVPVRAFQATTDVQPFYGGSFDEALDWVRSGVGDAPMDEAQAVGKFRAVDPVMFADDGPGVVEVLTAWARRNGCADTFAEQPVSEHVRLLTWDDCPVDAPVELYVVEGAGHTWPGSTRDATFEHLVGPTTMEIDATDLIWEFFQQHHRDDG
jgi:polyhydroxybutyrate depolymerase